MANGNAGLIWDKIKAMAQQGDDPDNVIEIVRDFLAEVDRLGQTDQIDRLRRLLVETGVNPAYHQQKKITSGVLCQY